MIRTENNDFSDVEAMETQLLPKLMESKKVKPRVQYSFLETPYYGRREVRPEKA